ncbi:MAG: hypothetical protein ACHP7O_09845 [Burkholderiales bacterium]
MKNAIEKPMGDKALRAWEDSRDLAAELEQSVNEMLAKASRCR